MAITPNTNLKLLKLPIELDSKNQINFASKQAQYNYFNSLEKLEVDNFTYQRRDNIIRYPANIDDIIMYNYCMYQNESYTDKWFYCYITNMEYVNDNMTAITIKTDVFQTWQFDIEYKQTFVEREHVNNDTIGLHTVPENIEMGEYIVNSRVDGRSFGNSIDIIVGSTIDFNNIVNGKYVNVNGSVTNGIYNGLKYFHFTSTNSLNSLLSDVADKGQSDAIVSIFMGRSEFFTINSDNTYHYIVNNQSPKSCDWAVTVIGGESIYPISKPSSLDGYTPTNKKLLTFPYCFINADNNNGANAIYKYEYFSSNNCDFIFYGTVSPGMNIRLYPKNYNGQSRNINEGLNIGKLPICSWNTDVYTNWLTQNAVNIGINVGTSLLQVGAGVGLSMTGSGALAGGSQIASGLTGIASTLGQVYQHSLTPPQIEGNINNGDVAYSTGDNRISMYLTSIKQEYAKIIDNYFSMFGYKVNITKIPNITGRRNWNFIKTIDCNLHGYCPQTDIDELKQMFNTGITIWHNTNTFLDYSQNNSII